MSMPPPNINSGGALAKYRRVGQLSPIDPRTHLGTVQTVAY